MTDLTSEAEHDLVYGASFALYDKQALLEFLEPFRVRLHANGLTASDLFKGRRCLDAGCGNGRGSLLMLENGASHVTAVDISATNIESTTKNLRDFGFSNFDTRLTSLEALPFEANSFDFVWCNGVLMHTAHPDRCLAELSRVLAPQGRSWIYVYGADGVYWHCIRVFRRLLAEVTAPRLIAALQLLNYTTRFIGEYVDDWKTPYLRGYPADVFEQSLAAAGFGEARRLMHGMSYDTCARIARFPGEKRWLGEGDLRYLLTKTAAARAPDRRLEGFSIDAPPSANDAEVLSTFDGDLQQLATRAATPLQLIAACARIQHFLREHVMSSGEPIDVTALKGRLSETLALLGEAS